MRNWFFDVFISSYRSGIHKVTRSSHEVWIVDIMARLYHGRVCSSGFFLIHTSRTTIQRIYPPDTGETVPEN